jgi:hypothetical protein
LSRRAEIRVKRELWRRWRIGINEGEAWVGYGCVGIGKEKRFIKRHGAAKVRKTSVFVLIK